MLFRSVPGDKFHLSGFFGGFLRDNNQPKLDLIIPYNTNLGESEPKIEVRSQMMRVEVGCGGVGRWRGIIGLVNTVLTQGRFPPKGI